MTGWKIPGFSKRREAKMVPLEKEGSSEAIYLSLFSGVERHTKGVFQGPGAEKQTIVVLHAQLCSAKYQNGLG